MRRSICPNSERFSLKKYVSGLPSSCLRSHWIGVMPLSSARRWFAKRFERSSAVISRAASSPVALKVAAIC
ncbi:hypothetical protein VUR80DRAFT_10257 [Thermomyces stellatus]